MLHEPKALTDRKNGTSGLIHVPKRERAVAVCCSANQLAFRLRKAKKTTQNGFQIETVDDLQRGHAEIRFEPLYQSLCVPATRDNATLRSDFKFL